MARWVSQAESSSVSKSARTRTAYLAPVVGEVDAVIASYFAARPDGEDVTVQVLQSLGRARLVRLAGSERQLDTVKQDVGLLVALRLVDLYGASRILSRREDDGRRASTRPARSGPDWVNRFTPHRLLPDSSTHRIVLDTNAVRAVLHGDSDALDLAELERLKGPRSVSIADPAWAELIKQFHDGRIKPHEWSERIKAFDRVLDPQLPLAPSGHEAAAMSGMADPRKYDFAQTRAYYRAVWRYVADSKSPRDFARKEVFEAPNGARFQIGPLPKERVREVLAERARLWDRFIASLRIGEQGDTDELANAILNNLTLGLGDAQVDKLDLVARVIADYAMKVNDPRHPYVPDPNDAIDLDVLFAVALPAIVCTSDGGLLKLAKRSGSGLGWKVMKPAELLEWLRR